MLVECEPAIKSLLVHIDFEHQHEFIIDDLDETHLFVKETMLQVLKQKLEDVSLVGRFSLRSELTGMRSVSKRRTGPRSLWTTVNRRKSASSGGVSSVLRCGCRTADELGARVWRQRRWDLRITTVMPVYQ